MKDFEDRGTYSFARKIESVFGFSLYLKGNDFENQGCFNMNQIFAEIIKLLTEKYGQTEAELMDKLKFREAKFGQSSKTERDFYWWLLNELVNQLSRLLVDSPDRRLSELRYVYLLMFSFVKREGRNGSHINEIINKIDIQKAELLPYECSIKINTVKDCEYSQQFKGVAIPFDVALDNFPLDYSKCDREGGCVCSAVIVPLRDSKGYLKIKDSSQR